MKLFIYYYFNGKNHSNVNFTTVYMHQVTLIPQNWFDCAFLLEAMQLIYKGNTRVTLDSLLE